MKSFNVFSSTLIALLSVLMAGQAASLTTVKNSSISVPAGDIASGLPGATNLTGSNVLLSAVESQTQHGGRASLVWSRGWTRCHEDTAYYGPTHAINGIMRGDGSIVLCGYTSDLNYRYDFLVLCYAADGTPMWTNRYDGPAHGDDFPYYLAADENGNVWVAGSSLRDQTNWVHQDVVLIKYAADGLPVWTNRYAGVNSMGTTPKELAVDKLGNAYVAHGLTLWEPSGSGTPVEDVITKYDPEGNVLWTRHYSYQVAGSDLYSLEAMTLDGAGKLIVAGTGLDGKISILKYTEEGSGIWTNNSELWLARAIQVDRHENIFVTGETFTDSRTDYAVLKLSQSGTLLWTNLMQGPRYNGGCVPQTVLDPAGNVYLAGGEKDASMTGRYQILKLNGQGVPLWTNQVSFGPTNGTIESLAADHAGRLYVFGDTRFGSSYEASVIKFAEDGQTIWRHQIEELNLGNVLDVIVANPTGNMYVISGAQNAVSISKYRDLFLYTPPKGFVGSDSVSCALADNLGASTNALMDVLVSPGSFRFDPPAPFALSPSGSCLLKLEGIPGTNAVTVEMSRDLTHWQPIQTNYPVGGTVISFDAGVSDLNQCFYRVVQRQ